VHQCDQILNDRLSVVLARWPLYDDYFSFVLRFYVSIFLQSNKQPRIREIKRQSICHLIAPYNNSLNNNSNGDNNEQSSQ
jgi:hypothetical protein